MDSVITQPDTGQVAVKAASGRITLHSLRDPAQCRPGTAFTGSHATICGRWTFADAMPEDTSISGCRTCGACARAADSAGKPVPHLAARDHRADGARRR